MADPIKYGFYSAQAAKSLGTVCYATPNGGEVWVTNVDSDPSGDHYKWADKVYMGEVTHYLRDDETHRRRVEMDRFAFR